MIKILMSHKGSLIIFSGPSGVGKDTILSKLLDKNKNIKLSISATTRLKRDYEEDGKDYYFISQDKFLDMVENDGMLEFANYCGNYYGTPKKFVEKFLNDGFDVILKIETDGALNIMNKFDDIVSMFILPPSFECLRKRLVFRGSDNESDIKKRLEKAKLEIKRAVNYKYIVINDDIDDCVEDVNSIIKAERLVFLKNTNIINEVLKDDKTIY